MKIYRVKQPEGVRYTTSKDGVSQIKGEYLKANVPKGVITVDELELKSMSKVGIIEFLNTHCV